MFYVMKKYLLFVNLVCIAIFASADIAPWPRNNHGIAPAIDNCSVQMKDERVVIDLYKNYSVVSCTFNMFNHGDAVDMEVGFPEMHFVKSEVESVEWAMTVDKKSSDNAWEDCRKMYEPYIKMNVDGKKLGVDDVFLSRNVKNAENIPWFVWNEHFKARKGKKISLTYKTMGYGAEYHGDKHVGANCYKVFKYILNTGAGWYGEIEKADVIVRMHDVDVKTIESISPCGANLSKNKTLVWHFENLEPTVEDDIKIVFYNLDERRAVDDYYKKAADESETTALGKWYIDTTK